MTASKRLILENTIGQKVRSFEVTANEVNLIYREDSRRLELIGDLSELNDEEIPYQLLRTIDTNTFDRAPLKLDGFGTLRLAQEKEKVDLIEFVLPHENDRERTAAFLKKSSIGHVVTVALLIAGYFIASSFEKKPVETQLVTILLPEVEQKTAKTIKASEKKIVPSQLKNIKIANKTVVAPRTHVVRRLPVPVKSKTNVAIQAPQKNVERLGALAALGGLKNGAKNAQGLDINSLKSIRSAGVGNGGGGIGNSGAGGVKGLLPGNGLIAGSAGSGGRAESAGGYGTRGAGGGKAGYGKISLVGGTSGVDLPSEEAMVEGGLDRDQIAAVINKNKGQIIYCYEQGLQGQPELRGRVSVQFVIGAKGRITVASVAQSSLRSKLVEGCMLAKMKTWQFPQPTGNVNVDVLYPFDLRRVSSR
jgi:outer membrane biosynthesis protein TonB